MRRHLKLEPIRLKPQSALDSLSEILESAGRVRINFEERLRKIHRRTRVFTLGHQTLFDVDKNFRHKSRFPMDHMAILIGILHDHLFEGHVLKERLGMNGLIIGRVHFGHKVF